MPDPLQSLSEIADRCRAAAKSFNPSRGPQVAADVADLAEIVRGIAQRSADEGWTLEASGDGSMWQAVAETPQNGLDSRIKWRMRKGDVVLKVGA